MNYHWREVKENEPHSFREAIEFDRAMREPGFTAARGMNEQMYLHRHAVPLEDATLDEEQGDLFGGCDQGCFL